MPSVRAAFSLHLSIHGSNSIHGFQVITLLALAIVIRLNKPLAMGVSASCTTVSILDRRRYLDRKSILPQTLTPHYSNQITMHC